MADKKSNVDAIKYHYALSVNYTMGGNCRLILTTYIVTPRQLHTSAVYEKDGLYRGPLLAFNELRAASLVLIDRQRAVEQSGPVDETWQPELPF